MTVFVGFEKPSLEDTLEHYGVKGMRWGQRKKRDLAPLKVAYGKTSRRPTRSEILGARAKERSLTDQIKPLDKKYGKDPETGNFVFSKEHEKLYAKLFEGDQRVIATYMTRGEKAIATILAGPVGAYATSDRRVATRIGNRKFKRN